MMSGIIVIVILSVSIVVPGLGESQNITDKDGIGETLRIFRDRFNVRDWESLVGKINEESSPVIPEEEVAQDSVSSSDADVDDQLAITYDDLSPAQKDSIKVLEDQGMSRDEAMRVLLRHPQVSETSDMSADYQTPSTSSGYGGYTFDGEKIYHDYITTSEEEYSLEKRKEIKADLKDLFDQIPLNVLLFFDLKGMDISKDNATVTLECYFKAIEDTPHTEKYTSLGKKQTILSLAKKGGRWKVKGIETLVDEIRAWISSQ